MLIHIAKLGNDTFLELDSVQHLVYFAWVRYRWKILGMLGLILDESLDTVFEQGHLPLNAGHRFLDESLEVVQS